MKYDLTVYTGNCIRGEVRLNHNHCYKCPKGKFSLDVTHTACRPCPLFADCPGGDFIFAIENYWQSSNHSSIIHDCKEYKEFCLGGYHIYPNQCTKGHFGPLCKSCDIQGTNYNNVRYHTTKT